MSSEALLINAILNTGDATSPVARGVTPEMLRGFPAEYRWVLSHHATYGTTPSREAMSSRFPGFPFSDSVDLAFACDEIRYDDNTRQLKRVIRDAANSIAQGDPEQAMMDLASFVPLAKVAPLSNALCDTSFLDSYEDKEDALEMPWATLQSLTGGCRPGDLWLLAARTGLGKSWSAVEIAKHALLAGRKVKIYSLEMPKDQVLVRMHVALGKALGHEVDHIAMRDRVYDRLAYRKLVDRIREEVPGELFIHDTALGRVSPATVNAAAGDVDLSIVDHVGLMSTPLGKRSVEDWRFTAAISNELKEIAVGKNARILALSQINREGDGGKYPPKLKNLTGSDALGQDGDVIVTHNRYARSANCYSVEKNRHGASDQRFFTRFLPNTGDFAEISRSFADDLRDREDLD